MIATTKNMKGITNTYTAVLRNLEHTKRARYNEVPMHRYCNKMAHQFAKQKNEKPYSNRQQLTKLEIKLQKKNTITKTKNNNKNVAE